jgi:8-oxo-dGTP diphosphatase
MENIYVKQFVVGVLVKNDEYLAEKRRDDEKYFAGMTIFPGGHIEKGETAEAAVLREMKEELGIEVKEYQHLYNYVYDDGCPLSVFIITKWIGKPTAYEAENILWIKSEEELSDKLNREIFKEILKLINKK